MADQDPGALATPEPTLPEADPTDGSGSRGANRDPRVFVLQRELSEVHLLLDHVSANSRSTVSPATGGDLPEGLPNKWIEKVCEISWPPDGSDKEKADDAALLIRAKDYLNRLAHPASGSTIAFTLLVTQEDMSGQRRWSRAGGETATASTPTRRSLAQTAYPDLIAKAASFRRWMLGISLALAAALIITCLMSWYVAYGNAALAELASARAAIVTLDDRINQVEAGETASAGSAGAEPTEPPAQADPAGPAPSSAAAGAPFVRLCDRRPYTSAAQAQLCTSRPQLEANLIRAEQRLQSWLWLCGERCSEDGQQTSAGGGKDPDAGAGNAAAAAPAAAAAARAPKPSDAPAQAAAIATIVGSAVLPFLYGLLGAGAAIIRSLSRKIRESVLSPRDLHLSTQQLALGAVIGACIGLFVVAPGDDGETLLGPVALSASAISFVAGFGVEAVFQALEALISRIFNIAPAVQRDQGAPAH